jgi:hypothetical protein
MIQRVTPTPRQFKSMEAHLIIISIKNPTSMVPEFDQENYQEMLI